MKSTTVSIRQIIPFSLLMLCLPIIFYSCAGKKESPLTYGYTITTMPGWQIKDSKTSLHAVLGYAHFNFKSGGGHTNFLQFGAQVRQSLNKGSVNGLWAGGELTYINITNNSDYSSTSPRASAFTIGGVLGYRFQLGKIPISVYTAPSFLHRGGFNTTGMTNSSPASGFYGRLAFDIHFMSWLSKKGR